MRRITSNQPQQARSQSPDLDRAYELLHRARQGLAQLGDELKAPATAFVTALEKAHAFRLAVAKRAGGAAAMNTTAIAGAGEDAARAADPTMAGAAEAASGEAQRKLSRRLQEDAIASLEAEAPPYAIACARAGKAFDDAIERVALQASDYLSTKADTSSLAAALGEHALREELIGDGLAKLEARLKRLASLGEVDEIDRLLRLGKKFIGDVARATPAKLAKIYDGVSPNAVAEERDAAFSLKRLLDIRAEARVPPELAAARTLRELCLRPAFQVLVGRDARFMSATEFETYLRRSDSAALEPWEIDAGWPRRDLSFAPKWRNA